MTTTKQKIQELIYAGLKEEFALEIKLDKIHLERPNDEEHGDWATNAAMTLTKEIGKSPREIAEKLVNVISQKTQRISFIDSIETAGPGFINFKLNHQTYLNELVAIVDAGERYGRHEIGKGKKVMIEFGQPNTHKAFHVGHLKSAISGLAMVKLYENLGYEVIKTNFYGDIGMHVSKCTWGAMKKGLPADIDGMDKHERMKLIDSYYAYGAQQYEEASEAEEKIREINRQIYANEDTEAVKVYDKLRKWSLEHLDDAFEKLGIKYDRQYPESEFSKEAVEIVKQHIGEIFEESDGAIIYDGKKEGLTTWVFLTREGLPTYEAKDLALAYKKFAEYDPDLSIVTTSVEQVDRFKVVIRALERIDKKFEGRYRHIPFGWLLRDSKKTSSRMGESVKGMDVIEEAVSAGREKISDEKDYSQEEQQAIAEKVGMAGLRFLILSHEFHKNINYDPDEFTSLEGYSGPYILYSYARSKSILREFGKETLSEVPDKDSLHSEHEVSLIRQLIKFSEISKQAGLTAQPHLVCNYLYELSHRFNQFYTNCPVLHEGVTSTDKQARLTLTLTTAQVLKNGLRLLGIEIVEKM